MLLTEAIAAALVPRFGQTHSRLSVRLAARSESSILNRSGCGVRSWLG
jgi:hypothetical protein